MREQSLDDSYNKRVDEEQEKLMELMYSDDLTMSLKAMEKSQKLEIARLRYLENGERLASHA